MVSDAQVATLVLLSVAASFPCFLYGAWIMIDNERITWGVLTYHLKFIVSGLTLTTVPLVAWMVLRLFDQLGSESAELFEQARDHPGHERYSGERQSSEDELQVVGEHAPGDSLVVDHYPGAVQKAGETGGDREENDGCDLGVGGHRRQ